MTAKSLARWPQSPFTLLAVLAIVVAVPLLLGAQGRGIDPADLLKPLNGDWPTYSGDYTGKRFSPLKQINGRR